MRFPIKAVLIASVLICLNGCSGGTPSDTPPKNDTPSKSGTAVTMYASQDVNMRDGAGIGDPIIAVILRGEPVKVYSTSDGWSKIKYIKQEGDVKTLYLSKEKPISYEQRAQEIIKTMTIEEKVGQMFFVRCRKDSAVTDKGRNKRHIKCGNQKLPKQFENKAADRCRRGRRHDQPSKQVSAIQKSSVLFSAGAICGRRLSADCQRYERKSNAVKKFGHQCKSRAGI